MNWGSTRVVLKQGDITQEDTGAIVNAANSSLLGGGGVDGAIHRAGGPSILEECKRICARQGGCPAGQAVITGGGNLKARFVVHAVGPVWRGGTAGEDSLLRSAYLNSLAVAAENGVKTISFPSISTGAYRFPIDRAARIALEAVKEYVLLHNHFAEIRLVLFTPGDLEVYQHTLACLAERP